MGEKISLRINNTDNSLTLIRIYLIPQCIGLRYFACNLIIYPPGYRIAMRKKNYCLTYIQPINILPKNLIYTFYYLLWLLVIIFSPAFFIISVPSLHFPIVHSQTLEISSRSIYVF